MECRKQIEKTEDNDDYDEVQNKQTTNMRLNPLHPWKAQRSHSHTSPLTKTPPHQKVQNCYWNYLMTDLKIQRF